jgi:4'-phosphopantetheinyl transferase
VTGRLVLTFADVVRTITHPVAEIGRVAAWALDFGLIGDVRVSVVAALNDMPARPPRADEIFIWFGAPLTGGETLSHAAAGLLDARTKTVAQRFRQDADLSSFIAAHAGLRTMLGAALGIRPVDVHITRDAQGKPHLYTDRQGSTPGGNLHFNISHTRGLVAVALAGCPVGIDVETPDAILDRDQVARSVFAPESLAALNALTTDDARNALFYRFWTLGEAFIKATGLGIIQGLDSFAFTATGPVQLIRVAPSWGPASRWRFGIF